MATIIKITDQSTQDEILQAIVELRAKQDRMPAHWTQRRQEVGDEIDGLVDMWLARS